MLRNHAALNVASVTALVNSALVFVSVTLIGGAYFAALGRLALA